MVKLVNFKHPIRTGAIIAASMHFNASIILMFEGFLAKDLQYKDLFSHFMIPVNVLILNAYTEW